MQQEAFKPFPALILARERVHYESHSNSSLHFAMHMHPTKVNDDDWWLSKTDRGKKSSTDEPSEELHLLTRSTSCCKSQFITSI